MKKATCIVSLLMALALVLTGVGPVLAGQAQPPVAVEPVTVDPPRYFDIDVAPGVVELPRGVGAPYPGAPYDTGNVVLVVEGEPLHPGGYPVKITYELPDELRVHPGYEYYYVDFVFGDEAPVLPGKHAPIFVVIDDHAPVGSWVITVRGTLWDPVDEEPVLDGYGNPIIREDSIALTITYHPLPPFEFDISLEYDVLVIEQGETLDLTNFVTVSHVTSTPEEVTLSAVLPITSGVTFTFTPPSGTPHPLPPPGDPFLSNITIEAALYADVRPSDHPWYGEYDAGHPAHTVYVRGTAAGGYTDYATFTLKVVPPDHNIYLEKGWNLISLPVIPLISRCIDHVLADYDPAVLHSQGIRPRADHPDYDPTPEIIRVWQHEADGRPWKFGDWFGRCFVTGLMELRHIEHGYGYWIKMDAAAILTVRGSVMPPPPTTPPTHVLYAGWNLIGVRFVPPVYPDVMTVAEYLGPVIIEYVGAMWRFDAAVGHFVSLDPDCALKLGHGYWIYIHAHEHPLRIATVPLD
ncbi:hypothetical protein M1O19_05470 [Dehalococcoidia bacterium]|nr:hypothetical protein [Dehalococcoidia bacterium]